MQRYNPKEIEAKWQAQWQSGNFYQAEDFDSKRKKFVMLTEFPYPSGSGMHMGHMREYTLGDIIARQKRMQGYNVLFPMGYDAFGLPTENFAIKNQISPQQATENNVSNFAGQLRSLGFSFDWSRSFKTSDPDYYKWTQWLFLQFFKAGLAYQEEIAVNWCPFCRTGLSNEEVVNGRHERCGTLVEKKMLKQWLLRITDYADRLIDGLDSVDFPKWIADQQINWIGRSKGAEIKFKVAKMDVDINVFTTRPDTIYGVTFLVLAPEHPLVNEITVPSQLKAVGELIKRVSIKTDVERQESDREKTGVFSGSYAINPASGEQIPIWIADYVLMGYGTGAIMAVPGHDERDFSFASRYKLPIRYVIEPVFGSPTEEDIELETVVAILRNPNTDEVLMLDRGVYHDHEGASEPEFINFRVDENTATLSSIVQKVEELSGYNSLKLVAELPYKVHYFYSSKEKNAKYHKKIRSLLFDLTKDSILTEVDGEERDKIKRFWTSSDKAITDDLAQMYIFKSGFINSVVECEGLVTASGPYDNLESFVMREKVVLDMSRSNKALEKINYRLRDWVFSRQRYWGEPIPLIHCPIHGAVPVPDSDLPVILPLIDDYAPTENGASPLDSVEEWVNTVCPTCGGAAKRETDTMPNWAGSSWYYLRYFDPKNTKRFADFKKLEYWGGVDLYIGGIEHITLHLLYSRFWHQFLFDQGLVPTPEPYLARRSQGIILATDGSKMSKSKGNIADPTEIIDSGYGADALRLAIVFLAPYSQTTTWSPESLGGTFRFLQRFWTLVQEYLDTPKVIDAQESVELKRIINFTVKSVDLDLKNMNYNTAIATLMECVNKLYKQKTEDGFKSLEWLWAFKTVAKLLAPFAPHISEELWQQLKGEGSIHQASWPVFDESFTLESEATIAVQINGKMRGTVILSRGASEDDVKLAILKDHKIKSYLKDQNIIRTIFIENKLISIVVK